MFSVYEVALGNIRFITRLGRRKNPSKSNDGINSSNNLTLKENTLLF